MEVGIKATGPGAHVGTLGQNLWTSGYLFRKNNLCEISSTYSRAHLGMKSKPKHLSFCQTQKHYFNMLTISKGDNSHQSRNKTDEKCKSIGVVFSLFFGFQGIDFILAQKGENPAEGVDLNDLLSQ